MSFKEEVLKKVKEIKEEEELKQAARIAKAEVMLEDAKGYLLAGINKETIKEGIVVKTIPYTSENGIDEIDLDHLTKICRENGIAVDWSSPSPTGRIFKFTLNLQRALGEKDAMKLTLK